MSIAELFERHHLYRRALVLFICALIWFTTVESFKLAIDNPSLDTAAIIASIQVPVTALFGFVSNLYWSGRS